jgi:hypothetical protein
MPAPQINEAARKQIRQFLSQLNLIFWGFLVSIILFLVAVVIVSYSADPKSHELDMVMLVSAPLSSMALMVMAHRLFLARIKPAQNFEKLYQKIDAYKGATLIRFVLLDGAAFAQLIAFFLTENRLFIPTTVVVATVFFLYRPGLERFIKDMDLNSVEAQVMRDHSR